MFLALLADVALPLVWYGPATASFPATADGNPYDPSSLDARVVFRQGSIKEERLAYFDQGKWKAVLVALKPGAYKATLQVNGKPIGDAETISISKAIRPGYVRKGGPWGFQFDNGQLYWPMGHNLGWQPGDGFPDLVDFIGTMGKNGVNWARIWACTWDGKNPWWPNDGTKLPIGRLWPKAIARWDALAAASEKAGVRFQFVLFHHGQWSSTTDSNWNDNPWNTAKGGFLANPADFFSNPEAKRLAKLWIRYAVARWGSSPAIMSWELFNEVQWTDAVKQKRLAEVAAWHGEMATYIRSLDPVHHLVTSSSCEGDLPIWSKMDYMQPHGYPARIEPMVLGSKPVDSRPHFYGEVGPSDSNGGKEVHIRAVRDSIWSGLFALHSGAAQYWYWDLIPKYGTHRDYAVASRILAQSHILAETGLRRAAPELDAGFGADLAFSPGGGWEATTQFEYNLPDEAAVSMAHLSAFFQGRAHPELRKEPVRLRFHAAKPGVAHFRVSGISSTGGELTAQVNSGAPVSKSWPAGTKLSTAETLEVSFPAGDNVIRLDNQGSDWVQIAGMDIEGIGRNASAIGVVNGRSLLMRIEAAGGAHSIAIQSSTLADGKYRGILTDLETGVATPVSLSIKSGRASTRVSVRARDLILWVRRS